MKKIIFVSWKNEEIDPHIDYWPGKEVLRCLDWLPPTFGQSEWGVYRNTGYFGFGTASYALDRLT